MLYRRQLLRSADRAERCPVGVAHVHRRGCGQAIRRGWNVEEQDRYANIAIDSAGELPDGTKINGPDDLRNALLRRPEQFVQTFVEALLTYSMGRTREYYDMPTVRKIVHDTRASDYKFSAIVQAVVNTEQFKMRRVPQPEPVQSARR